MAVNTIRIGTRGSTLALWQAEWVRQALWAHSPDLDIQLEIIKTRGDKILDVPLAQVGGKGLFVKEIEEALLAGAVDLAVHSMKDMPAWLPDGLIIGAVPPRADVRDVLISRRGESLADLNSGARVGTSSLRRAAQLYHRRPDLAIVPLRGNLETRLRKLEEEHLDAIVLAAAGVERLGRTEHITQYLPVDQMLPAVGQGALCVEIRHQDDVIGPLVNALDHHASHVAITAERAFLRRLEGGCQVPIAALGSVEAGRLKLRGLVASLDGRCVISDYIDGPAASATSIGDHLASDLARRGAADILKDLKARFYAQQNR